MKSGGFITVEGIEGAGKSTAIARIRQWLEGKGHDVVVTREPGGTPLGEEIRSLLLAHRQGGMAPETEALLMFAARAEHLRTLIEPALATGQWVVCDRFSDASSAYQGAGRQLGMDQIKALAQWTHPGLEPDLTLWLDVPVELGLRRANGRSRPDRFESEKAVFFEAVRQGYAQLAAEAPQRIRRIDASTDLATVTAEIEAVLERHFND